MVQVELANRALAHRRGAAIGAHAQQPVEAYNRRAAPSRHGPHRSILIVDNYDSFVYNVVQWLPLPRSQIAVARNDAIERRQRRRQSRDCRGDPVARSDGTRRGRNIE